MSNRPAPFTEADLKRVIRAAKKEGLRSVEVRMDGALVIIPLCEGAQKSVETDEEISL